MAVLFLVNLEEHNATVGRVDDEIDVGTLFLAGHEVTRKSTAVVKVYLADKLARGRHAAALEGFNVSSAN